MKLREIKEHLIRATKKYINEKEAEYFADEVIETDIRKSLNKKYNHGIINDIKSW